MKLSQCTTSLSKFFFEFINLAEIAFVFWQMVVHVVGNVAWTCQHQKFKVNLTNIFIFFLLVLFITIRRTIELDQMQLFISFHLSLVLRLLSKINIYINKFCIIYLSSKSLIFFYPPNDMNHVSNFSGLWPGPHEQTINVFHKQKKTCVDKFSIAIRFKPIVLPNTLCTLYDRENQKFSIDE